MADPATREDYDRLAKANQRIEGFGLDTTMHLPCPFCAAPDFMVYKVLEVQQRLEAGAGCRSCGRSLRAQFKPDQPGTVFEFVQTGGPDAPDYLPPIRRVD